MVNGKTNLEGEESKNLYLDNLKFAPYKYKRVLTTDDPPRTYIETAPEIKGDIHDCAEWCNNNNNCKMFLKDDICYFFIHQKDTKESLETYKISYYVKNENAFVKNIKNKKLIPVYNKFKNKLKDIEESIEISKLIEILISDDKIFDIITDYYLYQKKKYYSQSVDIVQAKFTKYLFIYSISHKDNFKETESYKDYEDLPFIKKELNLSKNKINKIKNKVKNLNNKFKIVKNLNNYVDKLIYINNDF